MAFGSVSLFIVNYHRHMFQGGSYNYSTQQRGPGPGGGSESGAHQTREPHLRVALGSPIGKGTNTTPTTQPPLSHMPHQPPDCNCIGIPGLFSTGDSGLAFAAAAGPGFGDCPGLANGPWGLVRLWGLANKHPSPEPAAPEKPRALPLERPNDDDHRQPPSVH